MNFLKGIKNLFSKKKKTKDNFRKQFCELIMDRLDFKLNHIEEKPDGLSDDEWKIILNKIKQLKFNLVASKNKNKWQMLHLRRV